MRRIVIAFALLIATAYAGTVAYHAENASRTAASFDAAPLASSVRAEGRLVAYPGAEVSLAFEVPGTLRLLVREKERVEKGEVVAELVSDEQRASLAEARARVLESEAQLRFDEVHLGRFATLVEKNCVTHEENDKAACERDASRARLEAARATVARLEAQIAKLTLRAPLAGVVVARDSEEGQTVLAGAKVLTIADLGRTRVEAEIDEFDAGRIEVGASVLVSAEGYTGTWKGKVEEIPDAVVARRLKPQDPGRPSDTRVLLVKIAVLEPVPVKLGQRVEVDVAR
jgi:RND family efflux transporter MFP subunit